MIFLDSSFLFAFYSAKDERHERAKMLMQDIVNGKYGSAYVSDYVFDELVTVVFARLRGIKEAARVGKSLFETVDFLYVNEEGFDTAWKIFSNQKTSSLSFTDCTSVAAMKGNGIENIATFDSDFKAVNGITVVR